MKMEGQSIELEASPYRDFMPGDLDTRLIVAVELTAENPDAVRAEFVEFGTLWVKHGSEVWSREVENVPERIHGDEVLVGRADGGPKWPVGDTVTVVVEVEADPMGTVHLKAENVEIRRVS